MSAVGQEPPPNCTCTTYYSERLGKDVIGLVNNSCPAHGNTNGSSGTR